MSCSPELISWMRPRNWTSTISRRGTRTPIQKERLLNTTPRAKPKAPSTGPEGSSPSAKVFWLDRTGIRDRLRQEAERLHQSHPEIERVILFGSLARGDAVPGSDADLLLVLRDSERPFRGRAGTYRVADAGVGVAASCFGRCGPYAAVTWRCTTPALRRGGRWRSPGAEGGATGVFLVLAPGRRGCCPGGPPGRTRIGGWP